MFDNFVIACLVIFAIGCIVAVPTRGSLKTTQGKVGAIICTVALILIAAHSVFGVI